jgi:ABC-type sugar transport system ATPase subunit
LSNLDAELRVHMRSEIAALHQRLGNTMIYVTHDQIEAMTLADKIVVLRDGIVEQVGTPHELYRRPRNLFVAQFIGSPKMNVVPLADVELPPGLVAPANAVSIGMRPEHLAITNPGSGIVGGRVAIAEYTGASSLLHVELDSGAICLVVHQGDEPQAGKRIDLRIDTGNLHSFAADGTACGRPTGHHRS